MEDLAAKNVHFTRKVTALGRNGVMTCIGIDVWGWGTETDSVSISPINSKGNDGRCRIEVPKEELKRVSDLLLAFSKPKDGESPVYEFQMEERHGEQEYSYEYLIESAKNLDEAWVVANEYAKEFYGDGGKELGWDVPVNENDQAKSYEFFGGEIIVDVKYVKETTRAKFMADLISRWTLTVPSKPVDKQ